MFCGVVSCPVPIEGQAGENQQEPDGGAARADEPKIDGEHESSENKQAGDPGIAPATVRALHVGFRLAQAEHSHYCKSVKNPARKNKKIGELFECSRKCHDAGEHSLENQRAARCAIFRMNAISDLKENPIASHGVGYACAAQDRGIHGAEGREDHRQGDPRGNTVADHPLDHIRGDML